MRNNGWWDADTWFFSGLGLLMFLVFAAAFGSQRTVTEGSNLVPAAVLEEIRAREAHCQTLPAEEVLETPRPQRC